MKRVLAQTIRHEEQLYDTCGNYEEGHGFVVFSISNMGDEKYEQLVFLHEVIEYILVKARGITLKSIDDFDITFETNRDPGDESEPGDSPLAPYNAEHVFATKIEKLVAAELGICWDHYDNTVLGLSK